MASAVIDNPNTNLNANKNQDISISNVKTPPSTNTNTNRNASGINKQKKIPNTLIIYIKTRIANYYKINYDPSMSVPKVNSHTVYIDPLVEYTKRAILDLPNGAPKDLLLTQFFLPNQFDSLINRVLSSFTSMQGVRTLEQAKNEGVIDTNIQLTLNTLFKRNNLFYINNRPYTIIGNTWNKGDWEIDTKPVDKLITPFTPLKGDELESAEQELNDLGEGVKMGNAAAAGIKTDNVDSKILPVSDKLPETPEEEEEEKARRQIVKPEDEIIFAEVGKSLDYLLKEGLTANDPIGFNPPQGKMNPSEPLTFLFLISEQTLQTYFESQPDKSGIAIYNKYNESKQAVMNANQLFFNIIMIDFGVIKKTFDDLLDEFEANVEKIRDRKGGQLTNLEMNSLKIQVTDMNKQRVEYMKSLYNLSNALLDIFQKQQTYFVSLIALLEFIKSNYAQIIGFTGATQPSLAIQCIDLDIQIYSSLTTGNSQNRNMLRKSATGQQVKQTPDLVIYADEYSKTIDDYKRKHSEWFNSAFMNQYVTRSSVPNINTAFEIQRYIANPELVNVEHNQYNLYMYAIMLYAFINQGDLWRVYFTPISSFITTIQSAAKAKIQDTQTQISKYDAFEKTLKGKGVLSSEEMIRKITEKQKKDNEEMAKNKGKSKSMFSLKGFSLGNSMSEQERLFVLMCQSEIESCEYIYLYTYLLELQCLRQNCLYVSDKNTNQIYMDISSISSTYYHNIELCLNPETATNSNKPNPVQVPKQSIDLQKSIMWDVSKINTPSQLASRIKSNDKLKRLYISKQFAIKHSMNDLDKYCDEIDKLIGPVINEAGLKQQCDRLLKGSGFLTIPVYVPRFQKMILHEIKIYDEPNTVEFNFRMSQIRTLHRELSYKFPDDSQDWIVLRNNTDLKDIHEVRFNDIYSIIKMMNSQTTNGVVSMTTLQSILKQYKINVIVFDMINKDDNDDIKVGDFVTIKSNEEGNKNEDISSTQTKQLERIEEEIDKLETELQPKAEEPKAEEPKAEEPKAELEKKQAELEQKKAEKQKLEAEIEKNKKRNNDDFFPYKVIKISSDPNQISVISLKGGAKYELLKDQLQKIRIDISLLCDNLTDITDPNSEFMFFVKANVSTANESEALIPSLPSDKDSTASTITSSVATTRSVKYELVYNHMTNKLIYKLDQIPNDIIMFIYESCFVPSLSVTPSNIILAKATEIKAKEVNNDPENTKEENIGLIEETEAEVDEIKTDNENLTDSKDKINIILQEISGDNFKNSYKGQTLYQLLTKETGSEEKDDDEITMSEFLDNIKQNYKKVSNELIDIKNEKGVAGFQKKLHGLYNTEKKRDKPAIQQQKDEMESVLDSNKGVNGLNEELTRENFLPIIQQFRQFLGTYKTNIDEMLEINKEEIEQRNETITAAKEHLQEQGIGYEEYDITRTKEKKIGEMSRFELDKEKEFDTAILQKIEDILKKSTDKVLTDKYNIYKKTYEDKIKEIDKIRNDKSKVKADQKEELVTGMSGGKPSDDYYSPGNLNSLNTFQPSPYGSPIGYPGQQIGNLAYPNPMMGPQMGYPGLNQGYPGLNPGLNPGLVSPYGYNPQAQLINMTQYSHSNRALELTSKLAYYVSVELELYPGTSVNTVQMAAVKCSSVFERIREAWAEMMGYQYRPGTMEESYTYQNLSLNNKGDKDKQDNGNREKSQTNDLRDDRAYSDKRRGGSLKRRNHKDKRKRGKNISLKSKRN